MGILTGRLDGDFNWQISRLDGDFNNWQVGWGF
jgi:hypothetical protein